MQISSSIYSIFSLSSSHLDLPTFKLVLEIFSKLNSEDQASARLVNRQWKQWIDKVHLVENYRKRLMTPAEVRQEASHYLENADQLQEKQLFLVALVKLSSFCHKMQVAAANAWMILRKTRFRFIGMDFKNIQAPGVRLPRTLLDRVNLAGANLKRADLTDCSLVGTCFDGADLEGVHLGQQPFLKHKGRHVLAMALAPHAKQLASIDDQALYLWNLKTFKAQKHALVKKYEKSNVHLLFSLDGRWLFCAHSQGHIEIWQSNPLKKVAHLQVKHTAYFSFLALTSNGTHLISAAESARISKGDGIDGASQISVWRVEFNQAGVPSLRLYKRRILEQTYWIKCSVSPTSPYFAICSRKWVAVYTLPDLVEVKAIQLNQRSVIDHLLFVPQVHALLVAGSELSQQELSLEGTKEPSLFSLFSENPNKNVYLWTIKEEQWKSLFSCEQERIVNWQFLPNHQQLAYVTERGTFCIRDADKHYQLRIQEKVLHLGPSQALCLNQTFCYQLMANKIVIMPLQKFKIKKAKGLNARMCTGRFSIDEHIFYAVDEDRQLYSYQTATGKQRSYRSLPQWLVDPCTYQIAVFGFSGDAKHLLQSVLYHFYAPSWAEKNKPVRFQTLSLYDVQSQKELWYLERDHLVCALSSDHQHVVLAQHEGLELWHTASKQCIAAVALPFSGRAIESLILSPTIFPQALVVTREEEDEEQEYPTKVWQINWKKQTAHLIAACSAIQDGCFVTSERLILQQEDKVIVWNYQSDREEHFLFPQSLLENFAVSKNGSFMVTAESDLSFKQTKITLWNLKQKQRLDQQVLPFASFTHLQTIYLSPQGRYVIWWHLNIGLQRMYAWEIKKGQLHLLWKMPKTLEASCISLKDVRNLSPKNARLLAQLQSEP